MRKIHTKRTAVVAAFVIVAALLSGCNRNEAAAAQATQAATAEVPIFAVNTTTAVSGQIRDYLALSGDIVAGSTVDVYSDVAGKVTRLYVSIGSRVSRDAPLIEVDPSRPGANFVAGVARAPISGTIVALPAQLGMTISQAVPIARIAGGTGLELRLYVAERFISKMALGLSCEITLDAYPGEVFRGSVTEVSPVVDPASRTMEVRVNVDNPGSRLKSGMFAKVRIITERKNNIVKIPSTALLQRYGEECVFVAVTDPSDPAFLIAQRRVITPGINIDGVLEVQKGLAPDEEVVIRGQSLLEDGARINVIDRVAALSAN
ncbi:membrane protein [Spirochaetia bacterium]|nr:membrane protein [Spirochaetia bacterium]